MALELTISATLSVVAGSGNTTASATKQITQTTPQAISLRQTVPTSDTVISTTGITTPRAIHITNMDSTNYIDVGPESGGALVGFIRLSPGETCVFPIKPGVVIRGLAHTASVTIEKYIAET